MNKDIRLVRESAEATEIYYRGAGERVKKLDKKLAEKLTKISEAAKEASEYIKTRVD